MAFQPSAWCAAIWPAMSSAASSARPERGKGGVNMAIKMADERWKMKYEKTLNRGLN